MLGFIKKAGDAPKHSSQGLKPLPHKAMSYIKVALPKFYIYFLFF